MISSVCKAAGIIRDGHSDKSGRAVSIPGKGRGAAAPYANDEEPRLSELMDDLVLRRLMASDGVRPEQLMAVVAEARSRLMAK